MTPEEMAEAGAFIASLPGYGDFGHELIAQLAETEGLARLLERTRAKAAAAVRRHIDGLRRDAVWYGDEEPLVAVGQLAPIVDLIMTP